jgi:hypothetical protein
MRTFRGFLILISLATLLLATFSSTSDARPPIRRAFFDVYVSAVGSRLDDLPNNTRHCGVCHFDFAGGGPRNPYGLDVEVAIPQFPTEEDAILAVENEDSDNDGYSNLVEITDTINFDNTPTFPGLTAGNVGGVSNVNVAEIQNHLTPSGGSDVTPPDVTVIAPNGGESFDAGTVQTVMWTATDSSGIAYVDIFLSDDDEVSFKPIARGEENDGSFSLFVPNLPGTHSYIRVLARDNAGNPGWDESDDEFIIVATPGGIAPTTLRDFELAGTQPLEGGILDDPSVSCITCHGNYDQQVEPWHGWHGSMMGNAQRDPLYMAFVAIAEQDAPSSGDLCLRCHTPGGWQEGRSLDTSGAMMTAKDRQSVQCDFCHRSVDPDYKPGISPLEDIPILDSLAALPFAYANGQFVTDPDPIRRGPFADPVPAHSFLESPFHRESDICGTCHDVSNPAFVATGNPGEYVPDAFDSPHPDGDPRNMVPIERTFSEWSVSEYAATGVFAPQFAGNKPDGIVSTCQDCHMRDVEGRGCNDNQAPVRPDLPLHDLMGGNYFIPDVLPDLFPGEVDVQALQDGKQRAIDMLQLAASMDLTGGQMGSNPTVEVRITNETGHKLPSGYPEGRRIWLHVKAYDESMVQVYESGAYDPATGVLTHDPDLKVYEIHPGISTRLASLIGLPAGESFHFVLNDSVYFDNRIPPRGFTNAAFETIQSPPVGYNYPDGQYWDDTDYVLPPTARFVEATLYYQSTSKEFIEFLRDENVTNNAGQVMYDLWVQHGRAAPVAMVEDTLSVGATTGVAAGGSPPVINALLQNNPNPFNPATRITYSIAAAGPVELGVYDVRGRLVRTLVREKQNAGVYDVSWDGRGDAGGDLPSGIYLYTIKAGSFESVRKAVLMR